MSGGPGGGRDPRGRMFVALTLSDAVCAQLAAWARDAFGAAHDIQGVRLLDADALHLTLCFLGSVPLSEVGPIAAAVAEVVADVAGDPLRFTPAEVRWLPPRRPGVCVLTLHDREGRAGALQARLSQRLSEGGWYTPERRGWLPHVTVARVGRGGRVRGAGSPGSLWSVESLGLPGLDALVATSVALMRSWPGSRYESLARVSL